MALEPRYIDAKPADALVTQQTFLQGPMEATALPGTVSSGQKAWAAGQETRGGSRQGAERGPLQSLKGDRHVTPQNSQS